MIRVKEFISYYEQTVDIQVNKFIEDLEHRIGTVFIKDILYSRSESCSSCLVIYDASPKTNQDDAALYFNVLKEE